MAALFIVSPVVAPSALRDQQNGRLALNLLEPIDGGSLLSVAARSWRAMVSAAHSDRVKLSPVSRPDTYRTYPVQEQLFRSRYTPGLIPGRPTKRWNGAIWSLRPGMAPAAVPGTSNHGWGMAVDVRCDHGALDPTPGTGPNREAYRWLVANYERYGWSHEYASPYDEPWHIRYCTGDDVPQAVLDFERPPLPPVIPSQPRSVTMLLLDLFPGTTSWTAFQCDGKTIWWASNGETVKVLQRGGVPRVELSEYELTNMLRDVRAKGSCPVPNPSPSLLAAWNASALGQ